MELNEMVLVFSGKECWKILMEVVKTRRIGPGYSFICPLSLKIESPREDGVERVTLAFFAPMPTNQLITILANHLGLQEVMDGTLTGGMSVFVQPTLSARQIRETTGIVR